MNLHCALTPLFMCLLRFSPARRRAYRSTTQDLLVAASLRCLPSPRTRPASPPRLPASPPPAHPAQLVSVDRSIPALPPTTTTATGKKKKQPQQPQQPQQPHQHQHPHQHNNTPALMESATGNIRYVAVARLADRVPVAEYAAVNTRDLPAKLLEDKLDKVLRSNRIGEHTRLTITDRDVGSIHYDSDPICLYLVVAAREYQQRTAFKFLADLRREFDSRFGNDVQTARHSSLSRSAKDLMRGLCERYNSEQNVDKVAAVSMQVEEVKGVMQSNIQSVLRNQENIETLLDQTDTMKNEASGFQRSANRAKDKMWWKNVKLQMVIVVLVIAIIGGIIIAVVTKK